MTHTEESLMALTDALLDDSQPYIRRELTHHSLRLAIRKVLAERDIHKDEAEAQRILRTQQRERAERAEAEVERLRELIAELDGHEGAEGWSEGMRERIDAAMKELP